MQQSYYQATAHRLNKQPTLIGRHRTEVAVIGAGLTGLSTALELALRGRQVTVLEAQHIGYGASGRSGGQVLLGWNVGQSAIAKWLGAESASQFWQLSVDALALVQQRITEYQIDADYQQGALYLANTPSQVTELSSWQQSWRQLGQSGLRLVAKTELPEFIDSPVYQAGLLDEVSGHLHPLNYTLGIARAALAEGVVCFEQSPVIRIEQPAGQPLLLITEQGEVQADQLILAGNALIGNLLPGLAKPIMPIASYIGATRPLPTGLVLKRNLACSDLNKVLDYYRLSADGRLLFGGRPNLLGTTPKQVEQVLHQRMVRVFPQLADEPFDYVWGGDVAMTHKQMPDVGRYRGSGRIVYAQGFSGHGMALTGVVGRLLADGLMGNTEGLDLLSQVKHRALPQNRGLQVLARVLGLLWYRIKDRL